LTTSLDIEPPNELNVLLALFENELITKVPRGENSGRTLRNDYVVRFINTVGSFKQTMASSKATGSVKIRLAKDWELKNCGLVVFLQDKQHLKVYGAASYKL